MSFGIVAGYRGALTVGINQPLTISGLSGEYLSIVTELGSTAAYIVSHAATGGHSHLNFDHCGTGLFSFSGVYYTSA